MSAVALESKRVDSLRLSLAGVGLTAFILFLFCAQVMTGTEAGYASLVSLFILIGAAAVKVLGGPTTLPGLSVAVFMLQHVVVSQVAKAAFLQPATDRMLAPYTTITVYCVAAFGILCAASVYRMLRVDKIRPIFEIELNTKRLTFLAVACTIFAVARFIILQRFGVYEGGGGGVYVGGVVGPLRQFGFLSTLAVSTGTAAVIVASNGKRCVGFWNALAILGPILYGILGAGRQDAASSAVTFMLTLYAFRFKLRSIHYISILIMGYLLQVIIFPYALYARGEGGVRIGTFEERIKKAGTILLDVATHPGKYQEEQATVDPLEPWSHQRMNYYGKPISTLDRYSIILVTDNIVSAVEQRGPAGPATAISGFNMLLPRFLNPEKEALGTANTIAHYGDGLVNPTDFYTQVAMGFVAESFMVDLWLGAFYLPFLVSLAFFVVYRFLYRPSMFNNVFVVALLFLTTWIYSENTIAGQTLNIFQNPIYYLIAVLPLVIIGKSITRRVKEARFVFEAEDADDEDERPGTGLVSQPTGR